MFLKQMFTNARAGTCALVILAVLYLLSILTFTIAFFTPYWLQGVTHFSSSIYIYGIIDGRSILGPYNFVATCETVGLISGQCRYPYLKEYVPADQDGVFTIYGVLSTDIDKTRRLANDMDRTLYVAIATICFLYINLTITLVAWIFKLFENRIYMSFLSISFGGFYPIAALTILTSNTILMVEYKSAVGYSTILGTIAGGFMCLFCPE